jgi:transposase-like protein
LAGLPLCMEKVRTNACPNPACEDAGKVAAGNIILHGAFTKTTGASQRCLCKTCGTTFSGNTGTAYFGLRCSRDEFEQVMKMRVEGVSIAAIARIAGRARSAITRWVERASASAKNFNDKHLRDFELQLHPAPPGAQVRPSLQDAGDAGGAGSPSTVFP